MAEISYKIEFDRTPNDHKCIFCKKYTEDENNIIIQTSSGEIKINKKDIINISEVY